MLIFSNQMHGALVIEVLKLWLFFTYDYMIRFATHLYD